MKPRTNLPTPATLMSRIQEGRKVTSATAGLQAPVTNDEGWGERLVVSSSNVAWVQYNHTDAQLKIGFHNGRTYHYANVPEDTFSALLASESKGRFVARVIKKKFKAYAAGSQ